MVSLDQQTFVTIIDYLGTFAFAISGIRIARIKEFDLFGAFIVGMVTAVGGGTLRDVMLDEVPFWMTEWQYFVVTGVALVSYVFFHHTIDKVGRTMFLFDAIGLGLFTVVGFQKTIDAGFPYWTANLMGMLTGSAGGVLRDVLTRDIPLIFPSRYLCAGMCRRRSGTYLADDDGGSALHITAVVCTDSDCYQSHGCEVSLATANTTSHKMK